MTQIAILSSAVCVAVPLQAASPKEIYAASCSGCHTAGVLGAPKIGVAADWTQRRKNGIDQLVGNAIKGINAMPPKGGNANLSDADVRSVVEYMLAEADTGTASGDTATASAPPAPEAVKPEPAPAPAVVKQAPPSKPKVVATTRRAKKSPNTFNRLMKPPSERNLPPTRDGIHDPSSSGTQTLQHPREAFAVMPKANSGNRVDWVAALEGGDVQPRFDLQDDSRKPVVLDLNIVREVKGTMPDVVYPHKQHTEWLDCSNCHPAIFFPKKGANNISMASILLGEQCGVCHGKVAFPVSDCRRCHSKNKPKVSQK
jgi:c(7)-type cytochrome triheme protein